MKWRFAAASALALCSATAMAHPPYEGKRVVVESGPRRVEIAASYIDGIVFTDPAKVVVEVDGRVTAETDFYRDTSFVCARGRCLITASDSTFTILSAHVWILANGSLSARDTWPLRALGTVVHLSQHSIGYLLAPLFVLLPILHLTGVANKPSPTALASGCVHGALTLASVGLLLVWLYVVTLLTELWLPWVVAIALAMRWGAARIRPRRAGGGLRMANVLPSAPETLGATPVVNHVQEPMQLGPGSERLDSSAQQGLS